MHVRNYLLSTGRYLGLMWSWTLRFNPSAWSFKALPVELGIPSRPVAIVTLKNRTLSPAVEIFIAEARELANSMSAPVPKRAVTPGTAKRADSANPPRLRAGRD